MLRKFSLRWRYDGHDSVSNHQPRECLLNSLIKCRSKKTSKLRVTGLCAGNSPETGEFPAQRASYAENVSIWRRRHVLSVHDRNCAVLNNNQPASTLSACEQSRDFSVVKRLNLLHFNNKYFQKAHHDSTYLSKCVYWWRNRNAPNHKCSAHRKK